MSTLTMFKGFSPFELTLELSKISKESGVRPLNAGRGNPNWTAATPREAFFLLGLFAMREAGYKNANDIAGMPNKGELVHKLKEFLSSRSECKGAILLNKIIIDAKRWIDGEVEDLIFELVDGIIGDNYPDPDRMLVYIEKVVNAYLRKEMMQGNKEVKFDTFAVEGGSSAICYLFNSLLTNHLLKSKDKIAIMIPTFTPYLEIPHLSRYDFEVVYINAEEVKTNGKRTWQFKDSEIEKLSDEGIKALFVVNPSNPCSSSIRIETINKLKQVIDKSNKDLMIITDDVYGTFIKDFRSILDIIPYNTACVYSYSKYFGATGWRLGTISIAESNVFDDKLKKLSSDSIEILQRRYSIITEDVRGLKFIDRLVADSREVALNHTAGLSAPQQVQMALFSLFALLDNEDLYKKKLKRICKDRQALILDVLSLEAPDEDYDSTYYYEFDLKYWICKTYGEDFLKQIRKSYKVTDLLRILAKDYGVVLMNGSGFGGEEWSFRISLANLETNDYRELGTRIKNMFNRLYVEF